MPHTFPATDSVTCLVGRTPWSAADAPVGLLTPCKVPISLFRQRDGGVPRGPGGPPHHFPSDPTTLAGFPSLMNSRVPPRPRRRRRRTRGRTSDADPRGNAHKVRGVIRTPLAHPAGHGGIGTQWPCARHTTRRIEVGIVPGRKDRLGSRALLHPTLQSRLQVVFRISLVEAVLAETVRSRAVLAVLHPGCKKQADQGLRPGWTQSR